MVISPTPDINHLRQPDAMPGIVKQPLWRKLWPIKPKAEAVNAISKLQQSDPHTGLRDLANKAVGTSISQRDETVPERIDSTQQHLSQSEVLDPGKSFDEHARFFAHKHKNETKPLDTHPFAVAVVSRAYREMSNGNLTEQLISLASQQIPAKEVRAYIAVNNTRVSAIAGDVWNNERKNLEKLDPTQREEQMKRLIKEGYTNRGLIMGPQEESSLTYDRGSSLEIRAKDYLENQATLSVLSALTAAVNTLSTSSSESEAAVTNIALEQIRNASTDFLTEAQIKTLLQASQAIIRRRIGVMGVDCSSFSNAFYKTNHGQATNEAAHIAFAQGAKYIDVSDMDEFRGPTALQETVDLAKRGSKVDVLVRPLTVVTPQHPEQLRDSNNIWATLINYYVESLANISYGYTNIRTQSSGSQIVSAKAFRMHEYPHKGHNEDFDFAEIMRDDPKLVKRYALRSDLRLANRGRDVSWDGHYIGHQESRHVEQLRSSLESSHRSTIHSLLTEDIDLRNSLDGIRRRHWGTPNYTRIYEEHRHEIFREAMEERIKQRRLFLGIRRNGRLSPNAILPRAYAVWQQNPHLNADRIIEITQLSPRQRAFLEQNPLILKGVLQEMSRIQDIAVKAALTTPSPDIEGELPDVFRQHNVRLGILSLSSVSQYIEQSLPELFGKPLAEEPTYSDTTDKIGTLPSEEVNVANYRYLQRAVNWMKMFLVNQAEENKLPRRARGALIGLAGGTIGRNK